MTNELSIVVTSFLSEIKTAVESGDLTEIEKFLFSRASRPKSSIEQYHVLRAISDEDKLPLYIQLNSFVGMTYKIIEGDVDVHFSDLYSRYEELLNRAKKELSVSSNLRQNRTHLVFSLSTAFWQLCLHKSEFNSFWRVIDSIFNYYSSLERPDFMKPFQSTFCHIARALFIKINILVYLGLADERQEYILLSARVIKMAASFLSVDNSVKVKEFFMAAGVVDLAINTKKNSQFDMDFKPYFPSIFHVDSKYDFLFNRLVESFDYYDFKGS